jgi:hypothetical protein
MVLTTMGNIYILEFEVKRKLDEEIELTGNKVKDNIIKKRSPPQLGSLKYKDLIKRYEYKLVLQKIPGQAAQNYLFKDLSELFTGDAKMRTFKKGHVHFFNGVFKFIILDSNGGFTQLDRQLKFEAIISLK